MKNKCIPKIEAVRTMEDDHGRPCGEVRVLPIGGSGNILVGAVSFLQEMAFRRERIRAGAPFDLPSWASLEIYFRDGVC